MGVADIMALVHAIYGKLFLGFARSKQVFTVPLAMPVNHDDHEYLASLRPTRSARHPRNPAAGQERGHPRRGPALWACAAVMLRKYAKRLKSADEKAAEALGALSKTVLR
jgi:hypothetical protein